MPSSTEFAWSSDEDELSAWDSITDFNQLSDPEWRKRYPTQARILTSTPTRKRSWDDPSPVPETPPSPESPLKMAKTALSEGRRRTQSTGLRHDVHVGDSGRIPAPNFTPRARQVEDVHGPGQAPDAPQRGQLFRAETSAAVGASQPGAPGSGSSRPLRRAATSSAVFGPGSDANGPIRDPAGLLARNGNGSSSQNRAADAVEPSASTINVIAHDKRVQSMFDGKRIAWGVQLEICRGIQKGLWTWDDVKASALDKLRGANAESGPRVAEVLIPGKRAPASAKQTPIWAELDREQAAIIEGTGRGLGLRGEWKDVNDWYGGRVQQQLTLEQSDDGKYSLRLLPLEMRKSCLFGRYLGSRRLIRVRIPKDLLRESKTSNHKKVTDFLIQKHVLCGRVFAALFPKDGSVYLIETPEDYQRCPHLDMGDHHRLTFDEVINWYNPPILNSKQACRKWAERFSLGFSTTLPVLEFKPENVHFIADIHAESWKGPEESNPPAELIMTDGCGWMNGAALTMIAPNHNGTRSVALQGRIGGSKGLWILHPTDHSPDRPPKIWIRKSQTKVKLGPTEEWGREHLIFNVVAPCRVSSSRLNNLVMINLSHNGVPDQTFTDLLKDGLKREIDPLMQWDVPYANSLLIHLVERLGAVVRTRLQRHTDGFSRTLGFSGRDFQEEDEQPVDQWEDSVAAEEHPETFVPEPARSRYESLLELLMAGFTPSRHRFVYNKLKDIVKIVADKYIKDGHIPVASVEAFIAPDPLGVLNPGEIYFSSTKPLRDEVTLENYNHIKGEVLIYRNPCRLPSDVQKVNAVYRSELESWQDIILYSTKGDQSLPSWLAGGDADGDIAVIILHRKIIDTFANSDFSRTDDNFLEDNFESERDIRTVQKFLNDIKHLPKDSDRMREQYQRTLMTGLDDPPKGIYSIFHENAAYSFGYDDPQTVRLGYMFNTLLDSVKTGRQLRKDVYQKDRARYDYERPQCLASAEPAGAYNKQALKKRDRRLPPFVLDTLLDVGRGLRDQWLAAYEDLQSRELDRPDHDLLRPYELAKADDRYAGWPVELRAPITRTCKEQLKVLETFVDQLRTDFNLLARYSSSDASASPSKRSPRKARPDAKKQHTDAMYRDLQRRFQSGPDADTSRKLFLLREIGELEEIQASYAYKIAPGTNFPWSVAQRTLCDIKARSCGHFIATSEIGGMMSINSSIVKAMKRQVADDE